jgi:hypothetical protein
MSGISVIYPTVLDKYIFLTHFITNFKLVYKKFKKGKIPYSFLPSLLSFLLTASRTLLSLNSQPFCHQ